MNTRGLEIDNFCHNTFWTKFGEEVHANVLMLKLIKFSAPFFLFTFIFHAYLIDSLYAVTKYLNVNAWNTNKYRVEFWGLMFYIEIPKYSKTFYRKATAYVEASSGDVYSCLFKSQTFGVRWSHNGGGKIEHRKKNYITPKNQT